MCIAFMCNVLAFMCIDRLFCTYSHVQCVQLSCVSTERSVREVFLSGGKTDQIFDVFDLKYYVLISLVCQIDERSLVLEEDF